jgi:type III restriction enzyme
VRFIITVNALKEGWDCPFAYILASLADKSSAVDVEQILGRVLRMPHVQQHGNDLLNLSYVFTASNRFMDTLQSVVKGLNRAGFSDKDYRAIDAQATGTGSRQGAISSEQLPLGGLFTETEAEAGDDLDVSTISPDWEVAATATAANAGGDGGEPVATSDSIRGRGLCRRHQGPRPDGKPGLRGESVGQQ